jgi:hypothetical protein
MFYLSFISLGKRSSCEIPRKLVFGIKFSCSPMQKILKLLSLHLEKHTNTTLHVCIHNSAMLSKWNHRLKEMVQAG